MKTQDKIYPAELIQGKAVFELDIEYLTMNQAYIVDKRRHKAILDNCPLKEGDKVKIKVEATLTPKIGEQLLTVAAEDIFVEMQATVSNISIDTTKIKYRIECKL